MGETWFGHYRLDRLLGSGGTGQVWLAHDTATDRDVALKVLSVMWATDPTYRQRFTREARLAAQVRGPHLVPIHAFGELDGRLYLDMEFIEGTDVGAVLQREGPMSPARAVRICVQVASALDAAHRAGLVHRDVKPSNIMLGPGGLVHLIDFGTAHRIDQPAITTSSHVVGTLAYMAPERFQGAGDARSDQYALACVLYECLTARRPFGDTDPTQALVAHLMTDPPKAADLNHTVPAELDAVIARGMAKEPAQRWSSAGELASAAYAAVTGWDATTVETAAATIRATSILPQPFPSGGPRLTERPGSAADQGRVAWPETERTQAHASTPQEVEVRPGGGVGPHAPAVSAQPTGTAAAQPAEGAPHETRVRIAVAALFALFAAVGVALWLGQPGGSETDSAAPIPVPTTTSAVPSPAPTSAPTSTPPPEPAHTPAPAAAPPPIATIPVAWQPCDPAVDANAHARDGTPLRCVPTVGRLANWIPTPPVSDKPKQDNDKSGHGNGHDKPDKPAKPNK
ncbi:serine/threonine-protein kinase [Nocardia brasiliensis]|uniref:serine/threonine-protein kinase n=1 Tax=Nocardia brasiliensis TaxID=37326 RepID=UPI00366B8501